MYFTWSHVSAAEVAVKSCLAGPACLVSVERLLMMAKQKTSSFIKAWVYLFPFTWEHWERQKASFDTIEAKWTATDQFRDLIISKLYGYMYSNTIVDKLWLPEPCSLSLFTEKYLPKDLGILSNWALPNLVFQMSS